MSKRNKAFFISAAVAAIAVTGAYLYYPPVDKAHVQGAIAAVEKHQAPQIQASDVVLGDEQARKHEAALYGNLLSDATLLESISVDLASFARNLGSAGFDAQSVASFTQDLNSRADAAAAESLGLVARLQARSNLQSFSADLAAMQRALESRSAGVRELASFEQTLASMAESLEARSNLQARSAALGVESQLEAVSRRLENRQTALGSHDLTEMAEQLGSMVSDLQARQNLESSVLDELMLASEIQQLEARFLQQRVLAAARSQLASLSMDLQARTALSNFATDLASEAAALEHRALAHMQSRYEMRSLNARNLEGMARMAAASIQNLEGRAKLESMDVQSLESVSRALASFTAELQSHEAALAQRSMLGLRAELASINNHLEGRERLASVDVANLGARQLASSDLAIQNLGSFQVHLGNLAASLESLSLASEEVNMLGIQAEQLQSRSAALQSRLRS